MPDPVCAATSEVLSHYRRSGKAQRHHRQEQRLHHARADSETGLFASGRGYVRKKFCRRLSTCRGNRDCRTYAVAGGGRIGGGTPADTRFRQLCR